MKKSGGSSKPASGSNVRVVCRLRPMNKKELAMLENAKVDSNGNKIRENCVDFYRDDTTAITVFTPADKVDKSAEKEKDGGFEKHKFNFDYVFDCASEQVKVYEVAARPIIDSETE